MERCFNYLSAQTLACPRHCTDRNICESLSNIQYNSHDARDLIALQTLVQQHVGIFDSVDAKLSCIKFQSVVDSCGYSREI